MGDGYVELDPMSGGDKIDSESLNVSGTPVLRERTRMAGALEAELAAVKAAAIAVASYGLGVREIVSRGTITAMQSAVTLNAVADDQSAKVDCSAYRKANIWVSVARSASPPDKLILRMQYSDDDGTTWYTAEEQVREVTDMGLVPTSGGYRFVYEIPILGPDMRMEVEGVGTDGTHTFTVTTKHELKN